MKVGEKYVIEIDKTLVAREAEPLVTHTLLAKIKGFNSLVFDENGLSKLEKLEDVIQEKCERERLAGYAEGKKVGAFEAMAECEDNCMLNHKGCVRCAAKIEKYDICKFNDETEEGFEFCVTNVRYYADDWYFDAIRKDGSVMLEECLSEIVRVEHIDSLDKWLEGE